MPRLRRIVHGGGVDLAARFEHCHVHTGVGELPGSGQCAGPDGELATSEHGHDAVADQASIGSIAARGTSTWVAPAASGSSVPWLKKKITPSLVIAKFW